MRVKNTLQEVERRTVEHRKVRSVYRSKSAVITVTSVFNSTGDYCRIVGAAIAKRALK